jgi:uncharacterized protein (TIGR03790 family)
VRKCLAVLLLTVCGASAAWGLEKDEILVVYNEDFEGAKALANYYVAKRQIPPEHVLAIRTGCEEHISRAGYLDTIQKPVTSWIDAKGEYDKIKCVLLMRGIPLMVERIDDLKTHEASDQAARVMEPVAQEEKKLTEEKQRLQEQLKKNPAQAPDLDKQIQTLDAKIAEVETRLKPVQEACDKARKTWRESSDQTAASVDSELSVMYMTGHPLVRWLPNWLHYAAWNEPGRAGLPKTFMVCRLDGASDALVRRIIDDSIAAEDKGLEGIAYFDARGLHIPPEGKTDAYHAYDELIRRAAAMVEKTGMKTVLDDRPEVFAPNSCPNAALYCGWYSLMKYVPAFQWTRGAVGIHIASGEAVSLRDPQTQGWCKRMIDEGVAATFGPVSEPFLNSFPDPSPFFAFLLTGKYTVLEAFWYTNPMNSWMLTLIADPLYTPFRKNPKMTVARLKEVLKPHPLRPDLRTAP